MIDRSRSFRFFLYGLLVLSGVFHPIPSRGENGVTDSEIIIGMSNALSGPAADLGTGLKLGAQAVIDQINQNGGVHGRKITLISLDDGYEPKRTVENARQLILERKVFALFGFVGTPTSKAILPQINQEKVIFFAPFTGAEFLRNPVNRFVFNVRRSYFDEAELQVEYLTKTLGIKKIGIFLQNDAYGLAGKGGVLKALKARGMEICGEGNYERNTEEVDAGLEAIKKAAPEAVCMVGTSKAMAAFIKKAHATGFNPRFLNVSFVGTANLIKELGPEGNGVLISQVMPSPKSSPFPIVTQFQATMAAAGKGDRIDYLSLEGYLDAVVFVEILKNAGKDLTRDSFINAAQAFSGDLGGVKVAFSEKNHQGLENVYLTVIENGEAKPLP